METVSPTVDRPLMLPALQFFLDCCLSTFLDHNGSMYVNSPLSFDWTTLWAPFYQ